MRESREREREMEEEMKAGVPTERSQDNGTTRTF